MIIFLTESKRRGNVLDLLNLEHIDAKSELNEDLLPSILDGESSMIEDVPMMRIGEFCKWYEEVFPITQNLTGRFWEANYLAEHICRNPPRLVLTTYSCIETSKCSIHKIGSREVLKSALYEMRDDGTVLLRTCIAMYDLLTKKYYSKVSSSTVVFRFDIEDSLIEDYINTCEGFEGDGSFLLNGRSLFLIQTIHGQPLSSMGFPVMDFHLMIRDTGISLRDISIR